MDDTDRLDGFDVFVLALSILSLVNVALLAAPLSDQATRVVVIDDAVLSVVFLIDFLRRLRRAPTWRAYVIDDRGWLDFFGSLPVPGLRALRLVRVVRASRVIRRYGLRQTWRLVVVDRAGSALLAAVFLTIVVIQVGSVLILGAEADQEDANIQTASDALWWSYVTVTTVGYGDRFPVTNQGRIIGVAMLTIGVGLFGVLTGFLALVFITPRRRHAEDERQAATDLHQEVDELKQLVLDLARRLQGDERP